MLTSQSLGSPLRAQGAFSWLPPSPGSTLSSCQSSQKVLRIELTAMRDCFSVTNTLQFQRTKILLFPRIGGHLPTCPSLTKQFLTNLCLSSTTFTPERSSYFPHIYTRQICFLWGFLSYCFERNFSTQFDILL